MMKMSPLVRAKFRVKINSLACEARIIRREEGKIRKERRAFEWDPDILREHRIGAVRNESRATQLAYAFLRGVPYHVVERKVKRSVDFSRVASICRSISGSGVKPDRLTSWTYGVDEPAVC